MRSSVKSQASVRAYRQGAPSLSPLPRPLAASDGAHTFTFDSVQRRLPLIVGSVLDSNAYGEALRAELRGLAAEIAAGAPLKPLLAPDAEWEAALAPHLEARDPGHTQWAHSLHCRPATGYPGHTQWAHSLHCRPATGHSGRTRWAHHSLHCRRATGYSAAERAWRRAGSASQPHRSPRSPPGRLHEPCGAHSI